MKEELENQAWEELERLWGEHDERVEQLAREYPPERKREPRIAPLWRYAAAAMVAGVLAMGAWLWMDRTAQKAPLLAENRMGERLRHDDDTHARPRHDDDTPARLRYDDDTPARLRHDDDTPAATITITKRTLNPQPSTLNPSKPLLQSSTAETEPQQVAVGLHHDNDNDPLRYDNENGVGPRGVEEHFVALVEEVVRVDFLAEEAPSHPDPKKVWNNHNTNIIEQLAMGFRRRQENRRMFRDGILAEKM